MKEVTYYRPGTGNGAVQIGSQSFVPVTERTTDKHLIDAVYLAKKYGGIPWRDGDGIDDSTRYGIERGNWKVTNPMVIITQEDTEKTELAVYAAQYKWIEQRYGKEAAENANYGWAVETYDDHIGVATKIYGIGILYSEATLIEQGGELQITFEFEAS